MTASAPERLFGVSVLGPVVRWGSSRHGRTGQTPRLAYAAMRRLHRAAPHVLDHVGARVAGSRPAHPPSNPPGLAAGQIETAVTALRRHGFHVLDGRVPDQVCDELIAAARQVRCRAVGGLDVDRPVVVDLAAPVAPRYDLDEEDALALPGVQRIVADRSLLEVARRYLEAEPIQDLVAMWWSVATEETADTSAAAQRFHFDLDRLRFLKVFVYLTDVDVDTGPHVYVPGSHRPNEVPASLRADRRFDDREVEALLGSPVSIHGERGTVFLADTRGLHKGRPVRSGHRLVLQTEYATSLFGAPYACPQVVDPTVELLSASDQHPDVFARFRIGRG